MDEINLGIVPLTTAVSIVSHDQLWTALGTVSSLWSYSGHFSQAFATSHPRPPARLPPPHPQPPARPPP